MRRVPRNPPKVAISVQRDQDQQSSRMEVIAEPPTASRPEALQAKTTFVRIRCTSCLPSNLAIVGSLLTFIWEEDQGHYK